MPVQAHNRIDIARQQLQTSLRLYRDGEDLFSVITLAGAAEEILGKSLKARGEENSIDSHLRSFCMLYERLFRKKADPKRFFGRANRARNALKHLNMSEGPVVEFDLQEEARDMLARAVGNYWRHEESLTPEMEDFERERYQG